MSFLSYPLPLFPLTHTREKKVQSLFSGSHSLRLFVALQKTIIKVVHLQMFTHCNIQIPLDFVNPFFFVRAFFRFFWRMLQQKYHCSKCYRTKCVRWAKAHLNYYDCTVYTVKCGAGILWMVLYLCTSSILHSHSLWVNSMEQEKKTTTCD